ncbi:MAG: hypothetical protein F4Y57_11100 [Acidobacteria bacterium]|nr:hypothetical protein [Acidobacteriota bacterium]
MSEMPRSPSGRNGAGPGRDARPAGAASDPPILGLGPRAQAMLASLGISRLETPKVGKGGAYDIGTESFRKACALLPDGSVLLVRAYNTAEVAAELAELRARYDLPAETGRRAAGLEEVAELHGLAARKAVKSSPSAGQLRLLKNLNEAAALGASDLKLAEYETHGVLRLKCGAGEHTHGPQWKPDEAKEAVAWITGIRDGGDGRATMPVGVHAGFSIGQGGMPDGMPGGIGAFRGQLAWHGDMRRFLNLRLLPKSDPSTYGDLAGLGLEEDVLAALAVERRSESGLVIIGGSTGDGKSTPLVRHMQPLYEERRRGIAISTLEDPIEYVIEGDGIVQFAVNPGTSPEQRNANWSAALMLFVRINPDVGMVSEIRDAASVNEILHFVTSGHKVYTTVHADSANGVLFRLIALGVRSKQLAEPGVVNLVLRQKLVAALCPKCSEPLAGPALARVQDWLGEDPLGRFPNRVVPGRRNRRGCDHCLAPYANLSGGPLETARAAWAGYLGRKATAEFIRVNDDYRRLVIKRKALDAMELWLAPEDDGGMGGIPLASRLRRLVAAGVTDFEHVTNETLPEPRLALAAPRAADRDGDGDGTEGASGQRGRKVRDRTAVRPAKAPKRGKAGRKRAPRPAKAGSRPGRKGWKR